ncbi:MAG TPA: hypothetical protein DD422_05615 [Akkermansia sp.]|nr:hypothetical protein [Akkermansia sp.]HBN17508.1 hypothetical protein [Akkermansia sp.]
MFHLFVRCGTGDEGGNTIAEKWRKQRIFLQSRRRISGEDGVSAKPGLPADGLHPCVGGTTCGEVIERIAEENGPQVRQTALSLMEVE